MAFISPGKAQVNGKAMCIKTELMIMKIKKILTAGIAISLAACGGGGGGSSVDSYAGVWTGNLFLVSNSCSGDWVDVSPVGYLVNQSGTRVVVNVSSNDVVYEGVLEGDQGFVVGQEAERTVLDNGAICTAQTALRFVGTGGNKAEATDSAEYSCQLRTERFSCRVTYVGEVSRAD